MPGLGAVEPSVAPAHVSIEAFPDPLESLDVITIVGELCKSFLADAPEEADRAVAAFFPELGVNVAKQPAGFRIPAPPEVVSQISQLQQVFWNIRNNNKPVRQIHKCTSKSSTFKSKPSLGCVFLRRVFKNVSRDTSIVADGCFLVCKSPKESRDRNALLDGCATEKHCLSKSACFEPL